MTGCTDVEPAGAEAVGADFVAAEVVGAEAVGAEREVDLVPDRAGVELDRVWVWVCVWVLVRVELGVRLADDEDRAPLVTVVPEVALRAVGVTVEVAAVVGALGETVVALGTLVGRDVPHAAMALAHTSRTIPAAARRAPERRAERGGDVDRYRIALTEPR